MFVVHTLLLAIAGTSAAAFSLPRAAGVFPTNNVNVCLSGYRTPSGEGSPTSTVQRLLDAVNAEKHKDTASSSSATLPRPSANDVSSLFGDLEKVYRVNGNTSGNCEMFQPLLGLYDVAYVQTEREGDNPVGGKWTRKGGFAQKILSTRRAFQHLLPANSTGLGRILLEGERSVVAEAVNVISLDALFRLIRLTVVLRGDAVEITPEEQRICEDRLAKRMGSAKNGDLGFSNTLTPRTVRAFFDPPRIVLGKKGRIVNLNVGPISDVVLDTTYCDDRIRVGKGGNSGTRFLFKRCKTNDAEANEWKLLLARRPMRKWKVLLLVGTIAGVGFRSAVKAGGFPGRFFGLLASVLAAVTGASVFFSAGGIERDANSAQVQH